jgi:DNA mismatch repair ATPase MutS
MFLGYPDMFATVGTITPACARLTQLQSALGDGDASAAVCMARLARLMHLADLRHSHLTHGIAQLLLLWDFHVYRAVERWRLRDGPRVRGWLNILAEVEVLSALATLTHDHPTWTFAEIDDGPVRMLEAEALGHAMLPESQRVDNDVTVGPPGTFLFITGSNMSGKSTLLRALGQSVLLALAGGPSCARRLRLPPVTLRTSIHVQDSVVQGVSFFMAQLQRLKDVVSAADAATLPAARSVFYLLDEILAGTNSAERRIAATRVIRHLVDVKAIGAVTTHDLELGEQAELTAAAVPVYFTETVADDGAAMSMSFDYRLRPGVATSTNALRLMRMVGLDP